MLELVDDLKALKLHGMAPCLPELIDSPRSKVTLQSGLIKLMDAERTDREVRRLNYPMKVAKFPHHRDLQQFDFTQSEVEPVLIEDLSQADYMDRAHNLIFVGGTGTGKTHLATALGIKAIHSGHRVRFYNVVDLVNLLIKEQQDEKQGPQQTCRL